MLQPPAGGEAWPSPARLARGFSSPEHAVGTTECQFAWETAAGPQGPWSHLQVVHFDGREELSALYRYELTLLARGPAPEVDPHDLVGARATLRIATLSAPAYKVVHGVVIEAEELGPVPEGIVYRAILAPPLV